jgi:cell growth-regulating nucleolar protein
LPQGHSTCVSEHEKYALGATKPGGYAAGGFYTEGGQAPAAAAAAPAAAAAAGEQEVIGLQFLSERPPWRCSCCNVNCTSRDTLLGHATGVKHKRRVSEVGLCLFRNNHC